MENNIINSVEEFKTNLNKKVYKAYKEAIKAFIEDNGTLFSSSIFKDLNYKYIIIRRTLDEDNPSVMISFEKEDNFYILTKKVFEQLCYNNIDTLIENGTCSDILTINALTDIINRIEVEAKNRLIEHTKYGWVANSSDDCFQDKSKQYFDTKEEAYNDMRNAALEKMKWNTEYDEDYFDTNEYDEGTIDYKVVFSRNKIVHESYSGVYTYEIVKVVQ